MKTRSLRQPSLPTKIFCWFFAMWIALPASVTAQLTLSAPTFPSSNTVRLVVSGGPVTNIHYDVYFTNALTSNASTWQLLGKFTNTVIFDLALQDTNQGFFIVTSNYIVTTNPPPKVATPILNPTNATGNASVQVTVTCDTPGAVIYYTTNNATPTTADNYIANGAKLLISCLTTAKARAFRTDFIDSDVVTGIYNVNCPPTAFAGNQQTTGGSTITLQGTASDDGLAQPLSNYWRQVSGPADISFTNRNLLTNTVTLPTSGIYVVQLEAFDGYWTTTSRVTIARSPAISISITAPSSGTTYTVPTNITIIASTNGSSVGVTQVQFFVGSQLIGTAPVPTTNTPNWTFEWRNVPAGTQSLYAVATSSSTTHLALASSPVSLTVNYPTDVGRFTVASTDLTIPAPGLPISINRTHDSRYGVGANLGINARLDYEQIQIRKTGALDTGYQGYGAYCFKKTTANSSLVIVSLSETEQYYFSPYIVFVGDVGCVGESDPWNVPIRWRFTAASSRGGSLTAANPPDEIGMYKTGGNCSFANWNGATLRAGYGDFSLGCWEDVYEPPWTDFTFTAPDGTQYKFDSNGKVSQRIDRNGNTLTFSSSGITHSNGKQVTFTRDGSSRITEIKDPIAIASSGAPAIKYAYDSAGRMTNVARLVDRAASGTYDNTGYRYEDSTLTNLITRVIDARGITVVSNLYDSFGRLSRQSDAIGNYKSFTYEDNGRRQVVTNRVAKTSRQEFTETAQLESAQNEEGAVTSYTYDSLGRAIRELTPIGATNSFTYNDRDELIATTNQLNFTATVTYNSFSLPLIVLDARGYGTTNGYDSKGNLIAMTNALGIVSRYGYDNQGNRKAETNAFGLPEQAVTLFTYDSFGYLTNVTDALGRNIAYSYDGNGNRLTEQRDRTLASGSTQTLLMTTVYDAANRSIAVVEADGFTNRTVFNSIGKIAYTTNKLGVVTRFDYDARGLLTNTVFALGAAEQVNEFVQFDAEERQTNRVDRAGRNIGYTYDGVGRLKRTIFPDNSFTENQYDAAGRIFATLQGPRPPGGPQVPPESLTTRFYYDAAGRRTAVVNALNQTNTYGYDRNGNQTNITDALGQPTGFLFDAINRKLQVTYPDLTTESYRYDGLNRRVAATNQALIATSFGYDTLGRLIGATNAVGTGTSNWTTYAYDEVGNQTNQTDALSRTSRFEYDSLSRRTRTLLPGNQSELFAYDAAGNLIRHTNFNGVVLTNQYDALNRLTNRTSGDYRVAFTYSQTGKRSTMTDASGTTTYAYDTLDRLITNSSPQGTLIYAYELYGNLQSITSSRSGGAAVTYGYDSLNRLTSASGNSGSANYTYDAAGNLQTARTGNSVTNTYLYTSLNRLTNIAATKAAGTIASFAYQLAAAGNRTNLSENIGGTSRTSAWSYDPLYRLTNEVFTGSGPTGANSYRYDAVGNRTNRTTTFSGVSGLTNQTFTYNNNDWLANDVYDSNGNTRTNAGTPYFYDVENRLTNYNNAAATYVYNGDGCLVRKVVGGTNTLYLVDDRNPTGYAQTIEEATVSGGVTNISVIYLVGLDLVAQNRGGTVNYYGYDGNGNVRYLTSTSANITDTYAYDAFGLSLTNSGSSVNEFLYSGERRVPETGLYDLRARYLNTGTGRFWTRDSFAGRPEEPASLHRYQYCQGDPVNRRDPSGHENILTVTVATSVSTQQRTEDAVASAFTAIRISRLTAGRGFMKWAWLAGGIGAGVQYLAQDTELGMEIQVAVESNPTGSKHAYENLKCVEFAADAMTYFQEKKDANPKRIIFDISLTKTPGFIIPIKGFGFFGMIDPPPAIAENGHHEGVLVAGRVFDNNVPFGVPRAAWENGYELFVIGVGEMTIGAAAAAGHGTLRVE